MQCTSCRLIQFRNFIDKSIFPDKNLTILTGVNGAGKTNVLEAIYMASIGRSFRTHQEMELIGFPFDECTILLYFIVRDMEHEIKVKLSKNKGTEDNIDLDAEELLVYNLVEKGINNTNDICINLKNEVFYINKILTKLELKGIIERISMNEFQILK